MDTGNWFVLLIIGVFALIFVYNMGKNVGKAILFVKDLLNKIMEMNRQEKP